MIKIYYYDKFFTYYCAFLFSIKEGKIFFLIIIYFFHITETV